MRGQWWMGVFRLGNPETAKSLQNFAKNPEVCFHPLFGTPHSAVFPFTLQAMRGWLQTQAIAEHYNTWESENK